MRMMVGGDIVVVFGSCCNMGSAVGVVGNSMPDRVAAHSHAEEPAGHLNSYAVAVVEVGVAVVGVGVAVACGMTVLAPLLS